MTSRVGTLLFLSVIASTGFGICPNKKLYPQYTKLRREILRGLITSKEFASFPFDLSFEFLCCAQLTCLRITEQKYRN